MALLNLARRRPRLFAVVAVLLVVRFVWFPATGLCVSMTPMECVGAAAALVVGGCVAAFVLRAGWLALTAAHAVAALPRAAVPEVLLQSMRRTGVTGVVCLAGSERTAFCAHLVWPRCYVTVAAAHGFAPDELDAVLLHEAAHARRRDPLRRLLARAASDVLFFLPLVSWWAGCRGEQSELSADRSVMAVVGRPALAGALLAAATPSPGAVSPVPPVVATSFPGASQARVAQVLGDDPPPRRLPLAVAAASLGGMALVLSFFMCIGRTALTALLG